MPDLDAQEKSLLRELESEAGRLNDWNAFDNFANARIRSFYAARGLTPAQIVGTEVYRAARAMSNGIAVATGKMRLD